MVCNAQVTDFGLTAACLLGYQVGRAEDKVTGLTTKLADSEELLLDYKKKVC